MPQKHKAGIIHIIGKPNVGKSTLINALIQHPISITTHKAQTTRKNIIGIDQAPNHQAIYIDTPGHLNPTYTLQNIMMKNLKRSLIHSDILLWVVDIRDINQPTTYLHKHTQQTNTPTLLILNKTDLIPPQQLNIHLAHWQKNIPQAKQIIPIAAINTQHISKLRQKIIQLLPIHPPYYNKQTPTHQPTHQLVKEIIRKAILLNYHQEIPYSTEPTIDTLNQKQHSLYIKVTLHVERASQQSIIIGKKGQALKKMGIQARKDLETHFKKKVFLQQHVKILPKWRKKKHILAKLGHQ